MFLRAVSDGSKILISILNFLCVFCSSVLRQCNAVSADALYCLNLKLSPDYVVEYVIKRLDYLYNVQYIYTIYRIQLLRCQYQPDVQMSSQV